MGKLWEASVSRKESSQLFKFQQKLGFHDYQELFSWSIDQRENFWKELIKFYDVDIEGDLSQEFQANEFLQYQWFPNIRLNFAQNLLRHQNSDSIALDFIHESGRGRKISYKDLFREVQKLHHYLKPSFQEGDVLACYTPNIPEAVVSMLATTSLGGVFTSTSCDFGVQGVVDRLSQSKPKVLVSVPAYEYNGKMIDLRQRIEQICSQVPSIEKVILVDFLGSGFELYKTTAYEKIEPSLEEISYCSRNFSDPLYIMYSSGTTGKPKCIVHSVGGTLLQHIKELGLHTDLTSSKSIFYFTTCGWMMWNWLVSSLFFGARIGLYEGSPAYPSLNDFMAKIDQGEFSIFGTSPKFLKSLELSGYHHHFKFEKLETILSTGAPLIEEQFDFVFDHIKKDVQLSSICGGTDIIGCFMLGNPLLPVYRGEIQGFGLGMDVAAFDSKGKSILGAEGELVCLKSFPSQPIGFLDDVDKKRFYSAYFSRFENIWHHGDFITITSRGGVFVHGRSDATLNPGGVRIGTAEIYRQTELIDFIEDSICVGKNIDGDTAIYLFVKLRDPEHKLSDEDIQFIKQTIRSKTTPRHVPERIIQVQGIPYTRSGKKMELVLNRLINGKSLDNIEAVSNPDCLKEYENFG